MNWYRCHRLLRSTLQAELQRTESVAAIHELHLLASEWLAANGFLLQALHHALATGDVERCSQIIADALESLLNSENWLELERALRLLPDDVVNASPPLLIAKAWTLHFRDRYGALPVVLERLEQQLVQRADQLDSASVTQYRGNLETIRALIGFVSGRGPEPLSQAKRALGLLSTESKLGRGMAEMVAGITSLWCGSGDEAERHLADLLVSEEERHPAYRARILQGLGYLSAAKYGLVGLSQIVRQLVAVSESADLGLGAGWGHHVLGLIAYEQNQADLARTHFSAAISTRDRSHNVAVRESRVGLAQTAHLNGNIELSRGIIASGIESVEQALAEPELLVYHSFQARPPIGRRPNLRRSCARQDISTRPSTVPHLGIRITAIYPSEGAARPGGSAQH